MPFDSIEHVTYLPIDGYEVDFADQNYLHKVQARMQNRLNFILEQQEAKEGYNALPKETAQTIENMLASLKKMESK